MDVLKAIEQIKRQLDEICDAIYHQEFEADSFSDWQKESKQEMICNMFVEQREWKNDYQMNKAKHTCKWVLGLLDENGIDLDSIACYPRIKRLSPRNRAVVSDFVDYLRAKEATNELTD